MVHGSISIIAEVERKKIVQEFFCKKVLNLSDYETSLRSACLLADRAFQVTFVSSLFITPLRLPKGERGFPKNKFFLS